MSLHPVFRHPVGGMPAAGRWYLASAAVLALLLAATHFAMQVHWQQQATGLVEQWSKQSGISVEQVRYRMLRGALTLDRVDIPAGDAHLSIASLLLQGNPASFDSEQPQLSRLELRGVQLATPGTPQAWIDRWRPLPLALTFWRRARAIVVEGGHVRFAAVDKGSITVQLLRYRAGGVAGERRAEGAVEALGGRFDFNSEERLDGAGKPLTAVRLEWQAVRGDGVNALFGLTPISGTLRGRLNWQWQQAGKPRIVCEGEVHHQGDEAAAGAHALYWNMEQTSGRWRGELRAESWPLRPLAALLPRFGPRRFDDGTLRGKMALVSEGSGWRLQAEQLQLERPRYRAAGKGQLEWSVDRLSMRQVDMRWPRRRLRVGRLELTDGEMAFSPATSPSAWSHMDKAWQLDIRKIAMLRIAPVMIIGEDVLRLPPFDGELKAAGVARWHADLHYSDVALEQWHVDGELTLRGNDGELVVAGIDVPFARLRALLPPVIRKHGSDLEGLVNGAFRLRAEAGAWQVAGRLSGSDIRFRVGEQLWRLAAVGAELIEGGTVAAGQHIGSVDVKGWHYHLPLKPLQSIQQETPNAGDEGGWLAGWRIDRITMGDGRITVGHTDADWLNHVELESEPVAVGQPVPFRLRGQLDGGTLSAAGEWRPDPERPIASLKVAVRDALPFFARDWLHLSGIPALTRGRIYMDMSLHEGEGALVGTAYLRLQHGALESGLFPDDPLLTHAGYNTHDLFARLVQDGRLRLGVTLQAGERGVLVALGEGFVQALRSKAEHSNIALPQQRARQVLAQVRLHLRSTLSHNERVRLRAAIAQLKQYPKWQIELRPQLGDRLLGEDVVRQIRYTQSLMVRFLAERGIPASRIFPVWPESQHRQPDTTSGVVLQAVM